MMAKPLSAVVVNRGTSGEGKSIIAAGGGVFKVVTILGIIVVAGMSSNNPSSFINFLKK
jgi:hypothetical protein